MQINRRNNVHSALQDKAPASNPYSFLIIFAKIIHLYCCMKKKNPTVMRYRCVSAFVIVCVVNIRASDLGKTDSGTKNA